MRVIPFAALVRKLLVIGAAIAVTTAAFGDVPRYKPSSRSAESVDITTNGYGASPDAPDALGIGDAAPDFVLPQAGGGEVSLQALRAKGPVALIFYRGHW